MTKWDDDVAHIQGMFKDAGWGRATASAQTDQPDVAAEMAANRRVSMQRNASIGGGSLSLATGRPTDPLFYWKNSNLPYNIWEKDQLSKVRAFARLLYLLHPVIGSCVDIFSKYPMSGMEIVCPKDEKITDFYSDLFLDQLDYEEFLIDIGREYWTVGEAWPFGTFNELLGVWEDDELLQPDDIKVIRSPFLREPRFEMRVPEHIRKIISERKPEWEYRQLIASYPDMVTMATMGELVSEDDPRAWMPVSSILLLQLKFKADTFHDRGVPLLMRGFRAVMQEEMLNAAQEAIASRLYTPLILAKLGASATDLGTQAPWIPTQGDLDSFTESMNAALAADFRMVTHHFAVEVESVFGRQDMPTLDGDFERLTERILQVFGLSKTMLSGGGQGETYAADALNRDLISQLLTTYQRRIKRLFKKRAEVVAEAQGHYDFETKGGRPIPIMEEVIEVDDETGEQRIVEQPKLLVPEIHFKAMNMRDEDSFRQFIEALRATGVPISQRTRLVNVPINLDEEMEAVAAEQVDQAVRAQQVRRDTYIRLKREGLPIPEDLRMDFEPHVAAPPMGSGDQLLLDTLGITDPAATTALVPTPEDIASGGEAETGGEDLADQVLQALPRNRLLDVLPEGAARPPESDEQRAGMPVAAALDDGEDGEEEGGPRMEIRGPRHVGLRRYASFEEAFYQFPKPGEPGPEPEPVGGSNGSHPV